MNQKYRKFNKTPYDAVIKDLKGSSTWAYKKFGQNFLVDHDVIDFMISSLNLQNDDLVIEIGPGMGALTERILNYQATEPLSDPVILNEVKKPDGILRKTQDNKIDYIGIEIDIEKIVYLTTKFPDIQLVNESIMTLDIDKLLKDRGKTSYKLIGSLPYNISKKIIQKFSDEVIAPEVAVLMVQKEVGEDYAVDVTKESSFLSLYLSQSWKVLDTKIVPKEGFYPVPEVDGMVLVLKSENNRDKNLIKFIKRGFVQPRKKLGNVLSLDKDNKFYNKRPHELNLQDWKILYSTVGVTLAVARVAD